MPPVLLMPPCCQRKFSFFLITLVKCPFVNDYLRNLSIVEHNGATGFAAWWRESSVKLSSGEVQLKRIRCAVKQMKF